ncbi:MAG: dephospho-CoA kinase, partial [Dokdonella sp.]|uniref:dephospho-CoA kinase n=1 Tax=Dokdonella sp. TaxID=2291710 RepID=UPI0025BE9738
MPDLPFTIALTGGIASGKSAVSERLAALGARVLDADVLARELVLPGTPALAEIVDVFGARMTAADGSLDRRALRERIFDDAGARDALNAILHPRIRAALRERAAQTPRDRYAVLAIPLLVENRRHYDWVDRVLVVDAPRKLQLARLLARDGIAPELAEAMLDAQATREQRLAIADDVVRNEGSLA